MQIATSVWIIVGLAIMAVFIIMGLMTRLYRIAGPNEALVITGFRGQQGTIVKAGGRIVFPLVEQCRVL
jgi:uncharacterized membrane protein YqiK